VTADDFKAELLQKYEARFKAGDGEALLLALSACLESDIEPPDWLASAVRLALVRYAGAQARTLDQAFGVRRAKGWHSKRGRKDALVYVVWRRVVEQHRAGAVLGRALFETIAEELNAEAGDDSVKWNGTDVQTAYYSIESYGKTKNSR
jgi:hypothetical protein